MGEPVSREMYINAIATQDLQHGTSAKTYLFLSTLW